MGLIPFARVSPKLFLLYLPKTLINHKHNTHFI